MFKKMMTFLLAAMIGLGTANAFADNDLLILRFGVNSSDSTTEMARRMFPITNYIARDMTERLGKTVKVELRIIKGYDESIDAFVNGDIDFGRLGPASYVLAKRKNPEIRLLAQENRSGQRYFNGYIIVHRDNEAETLADLSIQSFAFGSMRSTIGRYLSQVELMDAGIRACNLGSFKYLGRHDTVFYAVEHKKYAAGALKESTFHKNNQNGDVRVLHSFRNVTKPWLVRSGMDNEVYTQLRESFLNMTDPKALKKLKVKGFFATEHAAYARIDEAMVRSREFNICND